MKPILNPILLLCCCFYLNIAFSQNTQTPSNRQQAVFTVRGSVYDAEFSKPIPQVNIEVNGGAYTTTNMAGDFRIQVKNGDELVVKHKDFQTVYYTIKNNERIKIEVRANKGLSEQPKRIQALSFNASIDSAETYLKTDIEKSLQFITEALSKSRSINENAQVYEVLGDLYIFWKQYDIAISNYRISLQSVSTNAVLLKLAKAYWFNKNYQESITTYKSIKKLDLSNWQQVVLQEGLGDTYYSIQDYSNALKAYNSALEKANQYKIKAKITDLNSKIAQVFSETGNDKEAAGYFNNALTLASQETKSRAVEEKVKVADFKNRSRNFDNEIELRKQAIEDLKDIEIDSTIGNESSLTIQKQNYKIGNAYYLQKDFDSAKAYLEKSIDEASEKNDLVVAKDAKRKLSEVYSSSGEYDKALETYKEYTDLVEALYIKKEQEIIQAARFSKEIAEKQNRITSLESDRQLSESKYQLTSERNKRQQLIIYSLIGGLLLLMVTAYFMYKYIKQQRLANNLLALKSLRSQMNPHFIFNALNSVNSFIASNDERTANRYLSDFSQLMRSVLENSEADFIPLEKEIALLELYTKLEHFRFQDKFDYEITVSDNVVVSDFQIPPMLLQPYIENAVWHGLRYKTTKGFLSIKIDKKSHSEVTITITDNGIGRKRSKDLKTNNQKKHNSQGMSNIKKRVSILNDMYQDKVAVTISNFQELEDTGTHVEVTLKKD
ncbi:Tetratricopeptide repeat-containing protein [Bizionia echini]|uniref:Tetratricopeptide repeat-containing protein n=1 Tax=Bizionia echini TaxID=649333 RepID=A0A1I4ZTU3_9FLAO|nr:histidine kinase [Bizionia echini]SFN53641.1 Tetratricopeptide repeat-containing protein [Bizionia echini]